MSIEAPIKDIVERTGLAQSLVSRTIAQLHQAGVLLVTPDARDGRRTLVKVDPKLRSEDVVQRGTRPISTALEHVCVGLNTDRRARVEAVLRFLSAALLDAAVHPPGAIGKKRDNA